MSSIQEFDLADDSCMCRFVMPIPDSAPKQVEAIEATCDNTRMTLLDIYLTTESMPRVNKTPEAGSTGSVMILTAGASSAPAVTRQE